MDSSTIPSIRGIMSWVHNCPVSGVDPGRIKDLHWRGGGGGQKIMCAHAHHECKA